MINHTYMVLTRDYILYNNTVECDELAGHALCENIEWFEYTHIMWDGSMMQKAVVDKYCTQTDMLPTVMNLLGIDLVFHPRMELFYASYGVVVCGSVISG